MNDLRTKYQNEIVNEVDILGELKVGDDTYKTAVDGITKLTNAYNEMIRIEAENELKAKSIEIEREIKLKQLEAEKHDRRVKNGIAIGSAIGGGAFVGTLVTYVLKFEETQSVTTGIGRHVIGLVMKILPKK